MDGLVQRLVDNPHDEEAVASAYRDGQTDPRGYALRLERVGTATGDPAIASHWLTQAADAWLTLGDLGRAAHLYMKAVDRCPLDPAPASRLADLYREKGQKEGLAALLGRRAKTLAPVAQTDMAVRGDLALIHEELGQLWSDAPLDNPTKATQHYQRAVELDRRRHFAIYSLRELLKGQSRWAEAVPLFALEQELVEDPDRRHDLFIDEAHVRQQAGDLAGACSALRQAMRFGGADAAAQAQLAGLVVERSRAGESLPATERDEAVALYVGLGESFPGPEHGLAYVLCALELEPNGSAAMDLAIKFGGGSGREAEVSQRAAAFVKTAPTGPVADAAMQWLGRYPAASMPPPPAPAAVSVVANSAGAVSPESSSPVAADDEDDAPSLQLEVALEVAEPASEPSAPVASAAMRSEPRVPVAASVPVSAAVAVPPGADVESLLEQADALARRAKKREAGEIYAQVLQLDSANERAIAFLRGFLRQTRQFVELRDMLLGAGRGTSGALDFRARCVREAAGVCESQLRDIDGAVDAWQELMTIAPDDEVGATQLRRLLERGQRWDDLAIFLEQQASQASDLEARIALERTLAKIHEDKRDDRVAAGEAWGRIAGLAEGDDEAIFSAVEHFEAAQVPAMAVSVIEDNLGGIGDESLQAELYGKLGELRGAAGDTLGAGDAWFEAASLVKTEELWGAAEAAYVEAEAWGQAATAVSERAAGAESAGAKALLIAQEAEYLSRAGDADGAIARLAEAADLAPSDERLAEAYVDQLTLRGEQAEAVSFLLRRVERLDVPEQRQVLLRRAADMHRELGDEAAAIECLERVVAEGDDEPALEQLASHKEQAGELDAAIDYLERLGRCAADPERRVEVYMHQAHLFASGLNDLPTAVERFERILTDVDSGSIDALRAIAHLQERQDNAAGQADALERIMKIEQDAEQQLEISQRLADLYQVLDDAPRAAIALSKVIELDDNDFEAIQRLHDTYVQLGSWADVAELSVRLIEIEGEDEPLSEMTRRLAAILEEELDRADEALERLVGLADLGDADCRNAAVSLADRLNRPKWVGEKILEWSTGSSVAERSDALRAAFSRFVAADDDEAAIATATELSRAKRADLEIASQLEMIATRARDLDALGTAHDILVEPMDSPDRAGELVRQAEAMVSAGSTPQEAIRRGEIGLSGIAAGETTPLLERLAALSSDDDDVIGIYQRQAGRCQTVAERVDALAAAAQVASERGATDRSRAFFEQGLAEAAQGGSIESLVEVARRQDEAHEAVTLRTLLAEALASGHGSRDGGRTRAQWLVRAARLMHEELSNSPKAFEWIEEALALNADDECLAALLATARAVDDLPRAESALSGALEEVFDGPIVRKLLAARAVVRRDELGDLTGAAADLKRLHDLNPSDAEVMDTLEDLYRQLEDHRGMVELFEDQILRGKDPAIRAEIARKVAKLWENELCDQREAADSWRRVIRMKKGDEEAIEGLERAKGKMRERRSLLPPSPPPPSVTSNPPPVVVAPAPAAPEIADFVEDAPAPSPQLEQEAPESGERVAALASEASEPAAVVVGFVPPLPSPPPTSSAFAVPPPPPPSSLAAGAGEGEQVIPVVDDVEASPLSALLAETPRPPASDGTNGTSSEASFAGISAELNAEGVDALSEDEDELEAAPQSQEYEELDGAEFEDDEEISPESGTEVGAEMASGGDSEESVSAEASAEALSDSDSVEDEGEGEGQVEAGGAIEVSDAAAEDDEDEIVLLVDDEDFE